MDPYVYVRLCFFFFSFCILSGEKPHENVVFDPGIYVAEKEGCLFESETRSLGFLSMYVVAAASEASSLRKGGTRDMNMARISPLENSFSSQKHLLFPIVSKS